MRSRAAASWAHARAARYLTGTPKGPSFHEAPTDTPQSMNSGRQFMLRAMDRSWLVEIASRYGIFVVLIVLVVALLIVSPTFRHPQNLWNVLQQNSIIGIVALGMLVMMIAGGFDLSVGSVGAASSMTAAFVFIHGSIALGVGAALMVGLAAGALNGLLVAKAGINPFVTTLGTQVLIQGIVFIASNAQPIYGLPDTFTVIGLGHIGPVPVASLIFGSVALILWLMLRFTKFGHYVYAVGGNKEACRRVGVPVDNVVIGVFAIGGVCAAIGGLILVGQTAIGSPAAGLTWPLSAIAAVVVGGTPLSGGIGTVQGTIAGVLLLGIMANALNLFGVSPYWQPAITGIIILAAVGIDSYQRSKPEGGQ
jgi:ribose transport system permease protein/putative xylitol transport system permease protein